jgi:hypothetical protein
LGHPEAEIAELVAEILDPVVTIAVVFDGQRDVDIPSPPVLFVVVAQDLSNLGWCHVEELGEPADLLGRQASPSVGQDTRQLPGCNANQWRQFLL